MADVFSKSLRSRVMSRIRSSNTQAELKLKQLLTGYRLRFQPRLFGKPDFGLKSKKIAIFVDGCFWHKCPKCYREPKSRKQYWIPKIENNVRRAAQVKRTLRKSGFRVLRIWEHEFKYPHSLKKKLSSFLRITN